VFRSPAAERLLLARNAAALRSMLKPIGDRAYLYAEAMREPGRLTGALNWYRAVPVADMAGVGVITVPTTYVWSDKDGIITLTAALRTADWVDADYQLVAMKGIGHWIPEEAPGALAEAVLRRIGV
jgi:pimeloyl-ACP methyl ester carboxylesterase